MSDEDIRRYTSAELEARRAAGGSRSDLARVRAKTEEELERDIASDPDWCDVPSDWCKTAVAVWPTRKPSRS